MLGPVAFAPAACDCFEAVNLILVDVQECRVGFWQDQYNWGVLHEECRAFLLHGGMPAGNYRAALAFLEPIPWFYIINPGLVPCFLTTTNLLGFLCHQSPKLPSKIQYCECA